MLVLVMGGMLLPFGALHYLDYISMTWRVGGVNVSHVSVDSLDLDVG